MSARRLPRFVEVLKLVFYLALFFVLNHTDNRLKGKYDHEASSESRAKPEQASDRARCPSVPATTGQVSAPVRECK